MTITIEYFPQVIMDQIIARYGKPTITPMWRAVATDSGNVPELFMSVDDARACGWKHNELRKVFLKEWNDNAQLESDLAILSSAFHMEACPAKQTYLREAQERGYVV